MQGLNGLAGRCRDLVVRLRGSAETGAPPHAGGAAARPAGHALTTAALVCCLAHDHPERDRLRLAALTHELPEPERRRELGDDAQAAGWADLLREHGAALDRGERPDLSGLDEPARLLALAHLAAAVRLPVRTRAEFAGHPLAGDLSVDLVYGGATKIKEYVFESARLPEIRGASALLDHINRLDLPALWGVPPQLTRGIPPTEAQRERYAATRAWFAAQFGDPLDAPECLLYASGGNILALAPAGAGERLAAAIERRYTEETQVAQSVAVSERASLLELQYGRAPDRFWADDLPAAASQPDVISMIEQSFGTRDPRAIFGADSFGEAAASTARKGFGELVTLLAARANRRRAGDGADTGARRYPSLVDLPSHARKCSSCDARPAMQHVQAGGQYLCEACSRKRDAGIWAKKGRVVGDLPSRTYAWMQSWGDWLEHRAPVSVEGMTNDLQEIGAAARGTARRFVGLIYADGNNVGSHVAGLASIDAYRDFADQMLDANERAVAAALQRHVRPNRADTWPFEIITIGGDDVLLFVTAHAALETAAAIAREFDRGMAGTGITLAVGVLIMPENTPVRFARGLVEELLKHAKRRSKSLRDAGEVAGAIDFMALKSVTMIAENIQDYRRAALWRQPDARGQPRLLLTQRPYTVAELQTLIETSRALAAVRFPRSQLYQLRELVEDGQQLRSMVDYRYFVERGRGRRDGQSSYGKFDEQMVSLCRAADWLPWRLQEAGQPPAPERRFDTPLLDLIEIMPFVVSEKPQESV